VATATTSKRAAKQQQPSSVKVGCYADTAAAVAEAFQTLVPGGSSDSSQVVWVEGVPGKLFESRSALGLGLGLLDPAKVKVRVAPRMASEQLREACNWAATVQLMPWALGLFQQPAPNPTSTSTSASNDNGAAHEAAQEQDAGIATDISGSVTVDEDKETAGKLFVKGHMEQLFPYSAQAKVAPRSLAVLGGQIRAEKFSALDLLIDLVSASFFTLVLDFSY
jgi:hypothetical protein